MLRNLIDLRHTEKLPSKSARLLITNTRFYIKFRLNYYFIQLFAVFAILFCFTELFRQCDCAY